MVSYSVSAAREISLVSGFRLAGSCNFAGAIYLENISIYIYNMAENEPPKGFVDSFTYKNAENNTDDVTKVDKNTLLVDAGTGTLTSEHADMEINSVPSTPPYIRRRTTTPLLSPLTLNVTTDTISICIHLIN